MSARNGTSRCRPAAGAPADTQWGHIRQPTVSVVLPTYERRQLIGRAIRSVLNQTYHDFELIVVDDGSTDGTVVEVKGFDDPRLSYVRLDANRGAGAARNTGIRRATGRFIAFQDSDDEWLPEKLERHVYAFERCAPEIGVVYSDMQRVLRDGTIHYHRSPTVVPDVLIDPSTRFYQVCRLGIQSSVIRQECLAQVGDFNEAFPALEDLELFIRLSRRYQFHHLQSPLVRYYETDGLSKNMPAKRVARALLLDLYREDLERDDGAFLAAEYSSLHSAELPSKREASST